MNRTLFALIALASLPSLSWARARYPEPAQRRNTYSLSDAEEVREPAKKAKLPLVLFGEERGTASAFVPSGYMGDADMLSLKNADESAPVNGGRAGRVSLRVSYRGEKRWGYAPVGRNGWAGVYWLTPANNWGKVKGAGYDLSNAKRCRFWVKGAKGGEVIAEIKIGGITGPYGDSDSAGIGPIKLSNQWEQYTIDLSDKDMRHIVGGFAFIVRRTDNPRGAEFQLDEIVFDGGETPSVDTSTPTVGASQEQPPRTFVLSLASDGSLAPESTGDAQKVIDWVADHPGGRLMIEGFSDGVGSEQANRQLAMQRAKAVVDYFRNRGVAPGRMSVSSAGEDRSETEKASAEDRSRNRRVEVTVVP